MSTLNTGFDSESIIGWIDGFQRARTYTVKFRDETTMPIAMAAL